MSPLLVATARATSLVSCHPSEGVKTPMGIVVVLLVTSKQAVPLAILAVAELAIVTVIRL